jgi:predicted ATPase
MTEPVFVGRQREMNELQEFWDRSLAGRGQVLFVAGEAGSGKTALAHAFASHSLATATPPKIALGNCTAQSRLGDAYLPFRELLNLLIGVGIEDAALAVRPWSTPHLGRAFAIRAAQILVEIGPELIGTFVPGATLLAALGKEVVKQAGWLNDLERLIRHERSEALAPFRTIQQDRIFEQYANVLKALAAQDPLLLVVDDLHWADSASISLLFHLSRRIENSRILLIGTYRPEEIFLPHREERHPIEKMLAEVKRYAGDVCLDLGRVDATERYALVDQLVDSEPNRLGQGFRETLFRHTEGHPLFTIELLRTLQERGDIEKDSQGRWCVKPGLRWEDLPARVEGVIEERVGRLEARQRETLQIASVEGETFTAEVVAQVQQLPQRQLLQDLTQNLQRRHCLVLEQGEARVGRRWLSMYQFTHALFRHFVYGELGRGERRLLHAEVARALELLHEGQIDPLVAQLAWHYDQAGEDDKAVEYLILAGQGALAAAAPGEAKRCFDRALKLLPPANREQRWQALLGREEALAVLCEPEALQADVAALLALAREFADDNRLAEAYLRQARRDNMAGDNAAMRAAAGEAAAAARRANNLPLEIRSLAIGAQAETRLGKADAGVRSAEEALARARQLGDEALLALILVFSAFCLIEAGDLARAAQMYLEQVAIASRLGNRHREAMGLTNLGPAYLRLGLYEEARAAIKQGLQVSEAVGARRLRAYNLASLCDACRLSGDRRTARILADQALEAMDEVGDAWGQAGMLMFLGWLLEDAGDIPRAAGQFAEAHARLAGLGTPAVAHEALAGRARCALAQGQPDTARQHAIDIWSYLQAHDGASMSHPMRVYQTCADVFTALGDQGAAQAAIEAGYGELMERAGKISDLAWRQSFLENVVCNRALVASYAGMQSGVAGGEGLENRSTAVTSWQTPAPSA